MKKYLLFGIALLMVIGCAGQKRQRVEQMRVVKWHFITGKINQSG